MSCIKAIRNYLLDMDGTIYLGNRLFYGTIPLLSRIREIGGRAVFLTNNSSASPREYVQKLGRLGIPAALDDVFTAGDAAGLTLPQLLEKTPKVYLLGTPSLAEQLADYGIRVVNRTGEAPDCVLLGFDKTLTYARLETACRYIAAGVPYFATHPDLTCPVENGSIPDAGAIAKLIEAATGRVPVVFGKPERFMADAVLEKYGFARETTAMVGDRLNTDIRFANQSGMKAILVLTGETSLEAYSGQNAVHADWIFPSVTELCAAM